MRSYFNLVGLAICVIFLIALIAFSASLLLCVLDPLLRLNWGFKLQMLPLGAAAVGLCILGLYANGVIFRFLDRAWVRSSSSQIKAG